MAKTRLQRRELRRRLSLKLKTINFKRMMMGLHPIKLKTIMNRKPARNENNRNEKQKELSIK